MDSESGRTEVDVEDRIRFFREEISKKEETISIRNRELKESREYCIQKTSEIGWLHTQKEELERKLLLQDAMIDFVREQLKDATAERKAMTADVFRFLGVTREEQEVTVGVQVKTEDSQALSHSRTRGNIKRQLELRAENLLKERRKKEDAAITRGELAPEPEKVN